MAASLSTFRQTRRGRTHQTQLYNSPRKNFASLRNFFLSFVIFFFKRNEPTNLREEKDKNNQPGKSRRGILNLNKNKNKLISIRDVFWGNHNNNKKNIYFYRLFFFSPVQQLRCPFRHLGGIIILDSRQLAYYGPFYLVGHYDRHRQTRAGPSSFFFSPPSPLVSFHCYLLTLLDFDFIGWSVPIP